MAKHIVVPINNGTDSIPISNNTYTVTSATIGYDDTSILPASQEITEEINTYNFTITATGTLTLHVSDNGTTTGSPIIGATFIRCDSLGNTYGTEITSNESGNAIFNAVPFDANNAPLIYYKQTSSDGAHEFDNTLKSTTMTTSTSTVEIGNTASQTRTINLTDATYTGLPITDGEIMLSTN